MTTPQETAPDSDTEVTPGDATENSTKPDEDGQVSDAQGGGAVSDGDAPTGDPDLAPGEQPEPATEQDVSEDQKD